MATRLGRPVSVLLLGGLIAVAAVGQTPPPAPADPLLPSPPPIPVAVEAPRPAPLPQNIPPQAVPAVPTVDQLLDQLADLRKQKEELDRKEQAVVKALKDRLASQTERLRKLGVEAADGRIPTPQIPAK